MPPGGGVVGRGPPSPGNLGRHRHPDRRPRRPRPGRRRANYRIRALVPLNSGSLRADRRGIERGYYVKLGTEEAPEVPGWTREGGEPGSTRHRRPRRIPWGRWFLAAVAAAGLVWATTTPGGIGARLSGVDSSLDGAVADLTQSRAL